MQFVKSDLQSIFHQYDDIQELFFQGDVSSFDINARDSHGKTLLHHACEYGLTEGVKILLVNNAQVDVCDKKGYTPLHYTCQNNHIHYDICGIMIQRAPSKSLQCSVSTIVSARCRHYNRTILHYACIHGDVHVAVKLLKVGADPCAQDKLGNNPMHYACENGHLQCVRQLIATSQHPNGLLQIPNSDGVTPLSIKTQHGGTILHMACKNLDVYVAAKLLEAGADSNSTDVFGFTPLMRAVIPSRFNTSYANSTTVITAIITTLCNNNCDVNATLNIPCKSCSSESNLQYSDGSTALHIAIDNGSIPFLVINALVHNGAALDARDVHGRTPLHIASIWGHHRLIKLLAPSPESFHFKSNDGCTPLYYACKNSHLTFMTKFIVLFPDVITDFMNVTNNDGTTPLSVRTGSGGTILHVACDKGCSNLVKMLLKAGADPNVTDEFGFTPLMRAVVTTIKPGITTDVVSSIITALCNSKCRINASFVPSKPSDSNIHYCEGSTALHMAIAERTVYQLCVQALVDNGAALDARDVHGRTPLHIANMRGHHHLIKLLAPSPESFQFKDNDGCTPLYYACKSSHIECVREFTVQIPDVFGDLVKFNVADNDGTTPLSVRTGSGGTILHVACNKGDINVVKKLLEAGADPNVTDEFGFTPLMRAVVSTIKSGITTDMVSSIITALCNSKFNVNATFVPSKTSDSIVHFYDSEVSTALHMAIDEWKVNQLCVVQALIDNGAALNARDVHGRTPFHFASIRGHHHLIKLLASSPESFQFKDNDGCTPLYYACKNSHFQCITEFIVQAPDVIRDLMKLANNDGTTPLSVRTEGGGTILHVACDEGDINIVKKLLEAGADPNVTDKFGFTPLMKAVVSTSKSGIATDVVYSIIIALCNSKCSVNASFVPSKLSYSNVHYYKGSTALHMAIDEQTFDHLCVQALVDNGAALDARDVHGRTPLHIASKRGHHHLIKLLVPSPESFHFKDNDGCTPLYYACKNSHLECIREFVVQAPDVVSDSMKVANNDGTTPLSVKTGSGGTILHVACDKGDINLVKRLLEAGADPNVTDEFGFTPLMRAVVIISKSGIATDVVYSIIIALCNSKCSVNASFVPSKPSDSNVHYGEGSTALHMAINECTVDQLCVQALVDNGAALDARDVHGRTPLHIASKRGHHYLIKLLVPSPESFHFKDNDGCTPLYYACKNSHLECIREFVVQAPDVVSDSMKVANNDGTTPLSVKTGSGGTILHVACDKGDINLVKRLLEAGADPNVTDEFGFTPLMRAVVIISKSGIATDVVYSIIIALCNSKCSVNASFVPSKPSDSNVHYGEGSTALHMAINECTVDQLCVQALVDNGAALDARDVHGRTPLHIASMRGHHHLIKLLVPSPESFHFKDNDGYTPLYYACKNSHLECIREFLYQAPDVISDSMKVANNNGTTPLSVRTEGGGTILHAACDEGDHFIVKKVLEAGADPNLTDRLGCTPLHYACKASHLELIKEFMVQFPDVISHLINVANNDGTTPLSVRTDSGGTILHAACEDGVHFIVKKILEAGADPNVTDKLGCTPLHYACKTFYLELIKGFMVQFPDVICDLMKVANKYGATPLSVQADNDQTLLHVACEDGDHFIVKKILEAGADPNVTDKLGCTPLYYACKNSHLECVREFMVQIPDVICDLMKVANKYGATPLSVQADNDQTLLHVACEDGDHFIVKKILEAGADPNVTDKLGCTPLYYACKNSHLECVREFIVQIPDVICDLMKVANEYGATPLSVRADNDQTILHVACEKGDLPIVKKVLEAGADPNSRDGSTFTPLMLAVQHVDDVRAANIITVLCEFKCNVNIQTSHFSRSLTALHLACELGKEKCAQILAGRGANSLVRAKDGSIPLHLACKGGYHTLISSLITVLITEESIKACDYIRGWTPLRYACQYHHIECVKMIVVGFPKLLLQIHTEYNLTFHSQRDEDGRTILHHACLRNDIQFVENLLNLGADPNAQDNNGATPLMSALQCHGSDTDMNILSLLLSLDWKPDIKDNSGRTALHHSAKCNVIRIPLMLISAGSDVTAVDNYGQRFSDLISKVSLQFINKQLLRIDRRHIICVVGYPKCGKTTIIAAFQQAQRNRGKNRFTSRLKFNTRVTLENSRTSGIDTKVITSKSLGSFIFFDFAGQSEYYASHLAFLESALSAKGSTITFIMMVDLRCSEEDRKAQCKEWLFPINSILKDHNMLNVILIGSHLDQVRSVSTSTSLLRDTLRELKRTLGTPQMQFIDCWGMDCRRLSSKGMTNLQNCLQSTSLARDTSAEASQVPLGACLLFDRLKKSENPPLAITPSKIIDKLKDGRPPFPLTVKYIDSCCQDLAASGLVLYIPNREDAGESWLILEMEEVLSRIHGKLFAPDSAEFPMHHKNLANQFGLVHVEELTSAFKDSPLDPEMVQKLSTAMEFCHLVDSSLMTDGILNVFFSKVSHDSRENLLFFPSLVKANEESVVLSTESNIPGDDCHWVCWELSTVKPHFFHPRFQQAVFIRLACNHVQKHKADLGTVEEHSCTVSKNAMSWSTIHGVDVCVQIMHKSTIKVLARNRPGVKVSSLMKMFSSVISDVLTVRANHAPGMDAYSVFRVMEKGTPGEHTVPVSSIIDVVQARPVGMFVNSRERPPKLVSLEDLFLDWQISVTLLEKMVSISKIDHDPQATTEFEAVCEDTHSGPVMIDEHYYESELRFLLNLYYIPGIYIIIN